VIQYKIVDSIEEAKACDDLLTKLIMSERKYDDNVKESFKVSDYFTKIYDKDYNSLICALSDKEIIGFIYVFLKHEKGEFAKESVGFIDALYVRDNYRKQGIATNLINEVYKWCDLKEIKFVEIGSFVKNEAAFSLYKKFGFEVTTYYMRKSL